jgi:polyhydroxyalkanoate synthesis regulator phasin
MTAKEKAEELVDKMTMEIGKFNAKQCALIAINEIIESLETYDDMTEKHLKREFPNYLSCELQNMEQDLRYYEQVKREIDKL